jgi:hypothetical protein
MILDSIRKCVVREDTHAYIQSLWRTDEFRRNHMEQDFVFRIVDKFADMPSFFFRPSDPSVEKSHFATWWRGIQIRDYYDNPYIHDLYLLHELFHAGDLLFASGLTHTAFKRRMQENELKASVCSEIEIYFRIPGLRAKTFQHEIYADRFLNSEELQERWKRDPERVVRDLTMYRENVMTQDIPSDHHDRSEFWIRQFVHQNEVWASIWIYRYQMVEDALVRMRRLTDQGKHQEAIDSHLNWLLSHEVAQGGNIPFPDEAAAFAVIYHHNQRYYQGDFARHAGPNLTHPATSFKMA